MNILLFILQRFYWGLGAGCIINVFIILNYHMLQNNKILPDEFSFFMNLNNFFNDFFVFIVSIILFGIFLEGINETGCQYFKENRKPMYKKKHNPEEDNIYKKLNFFGRIYFYIFRETTTIEVCTNIDKYEKNKEKRNEVYDFLLDNQNKKDAPLSLQTWAKKIATTEKNNNIHTFKDLSFMFQLIRFSFLFISIFSFFIFSIKIINDIIEQRIFFVSNFLYLSAFLLLIIFIFFITPVFIPFKERRKYRYIFSLITFLVFISLFSFIIKYFFNFILCWYLISLLISIIFFQLSTLIAIYFGKRYVRDVGTSYNSYKLRFKNIEKR